MAQVAGKTIRSFDGHASVPAPLPAETPFSVAATRTPEPPDSGDQPPPFTLDEIHAFAAAVTAREAERMAKTRTAAGRALVAASRTIEEDGAVVTISDGDVLDAILAIEAEAIEPLLALVRAARHIADLPPALSHDVSPTDAFLLLGEARNTARAALAALPESVRVAARKPE